MQKRGIIQFLLVTAFITLSGCGGFNEIQNVSKDEPKNEVVENSNEVVNSKQVENLTSYYLRKGSIVYKYILNSNLEIEESVASEEEIKTYQLDNIEENRLLVWQDTFSEDELNQTVWNITEGEKNIEVKDGYLILKTKNENLSSATISTLGSKQFVLGKIETNIKFSNVPSQKGYLSATAAWSDPMPGRAGTMDIVRQTGGEGYCYKVTSIFELDDYTNNYASSPRYEPDAYKNNLSEYNSHTFSVEWDSNQLGAYLDNKNYGLFSLENKTYWLQFDKADMSCNPYHLPHYLMLGFEGDNYSKMEVDWIRVYAPTNITNPEELVPSKIGIDFVSCVDNKSKIPLSALSYEGEVEKEVYLGAIYLPQTVVDRSCIFSVDDASIASIDEATGTLIPHKSGKVTVTVTDILTGVSGSREINITVR